MHTSEDILSISNSLVDLVHAGCTISPCPACQVIYAATLVLDDCALAELDQYMRSEFPDNPDDSVSDSVPKSIPVPEKEPFLIGVECPSPGCGRELYNINPTDCANPQCPVGLHSPEQ